MTLVDRIMLGSPVLFICVHPDDEVLVGPLIALAAEISSAHVQCLSAGQSGWNLSSTVTGGTLGELRVEELKKACAILGATCHCNGYQSGTSVADENQAVAEGEEAARARWEKYGESQDHWL